MSGETFRLLLNWMRRAGVNTAAFIGGEPTLHPGLVQMVQETAASGIAVTLFTNGLSPAELTEQLIPHIDNFVINCNSRSIYPSESTFERFHDNLRLLQAKGARVTLSKNFAPDDLDHDYLLETAQSYQIKAIRYDFSRPASSATNTFFPAEKTGTLMASTLSFVRKCEELDIKTGLDCCMKFCDVSPEELSYLRKVSMKLTGICHPSVDIHPDLSASYCLPMRHITVDDVTEFSGVDWLIYHFSNAVREMRFKNTDQKCNTCPDFMRKCQGGCLASRQPAPTSNCNSTPTIA